MHCNLIVVFDAYRVKGHRTEVSDYHNIHVVFTKEAENADQYIEKFAMKCTEPVKERILKIYSMDGPGFPKEVLKEKEYEEIEDRIVKILPHSSLVGMLFETSDHYKVVESKTFGLLQHDPFTWLQTTPCCSFQSARPHTAFHSPHAPAAASC